MTTMDTHVTRGPETAKAAEDAMASALGFLHDLEGFVLGYRSLGQVLGWTPAQVEALLALGDRLLAAGRRSEALTIYEGALALDPSLPELSERLAICTEAAG